jgi:hypothetical protein
MTDDYLLDDDGYPTEMALERIRTWPYSDPHGWFEFVSELWWMRAWGVRSNKPGEYLFSTGGWSGNEDIIGAMQENWILWSTTWMQSNRGGHYVFEVRDES